MQSFELHLNFQQMLDIRDCLILSKYQLMQKSNEASPIQYREISAEIARLQVVLDYMHSVLLTEEE